MYELIAVIGLFVFILVALLTKLNRVKRDNDRLRDEINRNKPEDKGTSVIVEYISGRTIKVDGVRDIRKISKGITLFHPDGCEIATLNPEEVRSIISEGWAKDYSDVCEKEGE